MDTFSAIVVTSLVLTFGGFLLLGRLASRRQLDEITEKGRNRALAAQSQIEERDLDQMVASANEYRRRHGLAEVTVEDVKAAVGAEQLERLREGSRRARRAGPGGAQRARERRGF